MSDFWIKSAAFKKKIPDFSMIFFLGWTDQQMIYSGHLRFQSRRAISASDFKFGGFSHNRASVSRLVSPFGKEQVIGYLFTAEMDSNFAPASGTRGNQFGATSFS